MNSGIARGLAAVGICAFFGWTLAPASATAGDLGIAPVAQQSSEWCWAASTQMVFTYYGVPDLNPAGDYQCGVVGAQGGLCATNCTLCLQGGGTIPRIAGVLVQYLQIAQVSLGYTNPNLSVRSTSILSPDLIVRSIDDGAPVIAGVSPVGMALPPGWGVSQHAVVIEGYQGDASNLILTVNDPLPQNAPLWLQAGAASTQPGQYNIPYSFFVQYLRYGNSIVFDPNI